jgi:hypothetical protein
MLSCEDRDLIRYYTPRMLRANGQVCGVLVGSAQRHTRSHIRLQPGGGESKCEGGATRRFVISSCTLQLLEGLVDSIRTAVMTEQLFGGVEKQLSPRVKIALVGKTSLEALLL